MLTPKPLITIMLYNIILIWLKPGFHIVVQVVRLLPERCIYRCFHINLQRLILLRLKLTIISKW